MLSEVRRAEFLRLFSEFVPAYLESPAGVAHIRGQLSAVEQGRRNYQEVLKARERGEDITDLVLNTLLPHNNSTYNRERGAWVTVAPAVTKDLRIWFEGAGWTRPEQWPDIASAILRFVERCVDKPADLADACRELDSHDFMKGFQTGLLTPILNALRPEEYVLINNKSRSAVIYFTGERFGRELTDYARTNETAKELIAALTGEMVERAGRIDLLPSHLFDMFSHWLVAEKKYLKLGTGARTVDDDRVGPVPDSRIDTAGMLERWYPDPEVRRACAGVLVDCIELAHSLNPSNWSVTKPKRADFIRLNVGRVEVLVLSPGTVSTVVAAEEFGDDLQAQAGDYFAEVDYTSVPGKKLRGDIPSEKVITLYPLIAPAHKDFIRRASASSVSSTWAKHYEPSIVPYLRDLLGVDVPEPEYAFDEESDDAGVDGKSGRFVRTPWLPSQEKLRAYLAAVEGVRKNDLMELFSQIRSLSGTPQNPQTWTDPDQWIAERLTGAAQEVARTFWEAGGGVINPRHLRGAYLFSGYHHLVELDGGVFHLNERGRHFIAGDPALLREIDTIEGMGMVLRMLAREGNRQPADLMPEWSEFAGKYSRFQTERTQRETLHRRLSNLAERGLIQRTGNRYRITPAGQEYLAGLGEDVRIEPPAPAVLRNPERPVSEIATATGLDESLLSRWTSAINRKKQAVIYGPPGTGKTFVARHLAEHLVGGGTGIVELVQFHPAYSYEDFVLGIRPQSKSGVLEYPLVPGRFLEFCEQARERDGISVLIIDEINRANLARVFGELMYLLEYRDQEVPLAGGRRFSIPENVRIIGTMNTADRSIALVDHALRRRFAFLELRPSYDTLVKFHEANESASLAVNLAKVLLRLNTEIADHHYEVGISFFMTRDLATHLPDIWQMEIEPYLQEYFFDQAGTVEKYRWGNVGKEMGM